MYRKAALVSALSAVAVRGQQVGTLTAENHPSMSWQRCTGTNSCSSVNGQVVLDANWRYLHQTSSSTNCYTGNTWDDSICSTDATCAQDCALDGADYAGTYGITASGNSLKLGFVTHGPFSTNIGSRNYLMADENTYEIFDLLNNEFTFDVDVSNLPCGLNGALYFVSMSADGDVGGSNAAGAKYGTGYCILSALVTLSSLLDRLTSRDGNQIPPMSTQALVTMAPAALRWTSGRPTPFPPP
jgi:cellulose 1,4-beta-cellobiosidase